jgi:hypothetical protein
LGKRLASLYKEICATEINIKRQRHKKNDYCASAGVKKTKKIIFNAITQTQ